MPPTSYHEHRRSRALRQAAWPGMQLAATKVDGLKPRRAAQGALRRAERVQVFLLCASQPGAGDVSYSAAVVEVLDWTTTSHKRSSFHSRQRPHSDTYLQHEVGRLDVAVDHRAVVAGLDNKQDFKGDQRQRLLIEWAIDLRSSTPGHVSAWRPRGGRGNSKCPSVRGGQRGLAGRP